MVQNLFQQNFTKNPLLEQIIASAQEGIIVYDQNLKYQVWNPFMENLTGVAKENIIGHHPLEIFSFLHETPLIERLEQIIETGETSTIEFPYSLPDDKESGWAADTGSPLLDTDGNIVGIVSIIHDISKSKQAEAERLELEAQLRHKYKMEAVGLMAGGIAHNFNNNLAIILGNIEIARTKLASDSPLTNYLNNAKTAILRSRDLVLQILLYSRQGSYAMNPVYLTPIIEETLQLLDSTIPSTVNLQQKIDANSQKATVNADSSQIQEALINLCNNAVQAMDEKGELLVLLENVTLQQQDIPAQYEQPPGQYLKLSVQDNGCGMSEKTIEKIFDPFFTTKEVGQGTGMGLSTVQGIVDLHGGLIKVESTLGQGSRFELYFPVTDSVEVTPVAATQIDLPRGDETILIVDDDEMLVDLGEQLLSGLGYQVTAMTNSPDALALFKENPKRFDLVITDQTMPNLCGRDLIKQLLSIRPELATILCTGYSNKIDEKEAKELGVKGYMTKPYDLQALAQTVRKVLKD